MAYIGKAPNKTLTKTTSQSFNGTGSATVFTLNRAVNTGEELEVFVENVQQEPGSGKSYTASGTTLTFDEAPPSGTGNIYVIYRGQAEVTTRLEHDANAALAATTGTFSGAVSGTNGTFTGDLTVDTNTLHVDATNNRVGIGTVTPDSNLKIKSTGASILRIDGGAVAPSVGPLIVGEHNDADAFYIGTNSVVLGESSNQDVVIYGADSSSGNIRFYAGASTETVRIRDGGGITFNGDFAAANALDDYEFGDYDITLTPSSSGSITVNTGENKATYVKIGNFVQAQGRVLVSSVSSPAGDLAINLPFQTTSSQGEQSGSGAPALFVWNSTQTNNGLWCGFFDKSISAFYIRWGNASTPGQSASYIQAGTEIRFSVSYITDA
jgi:hypothetical protein